MKKTLSTLILIFTVLLQTGCVIREKSPSETDTIPESTENSERAPSRVPGSSRTVGDYIIKDTENGVEIVSYTGDQPDADVPEEIDGTPVVSIGKEAFAEHKELTSVVLPNSVLEIGDDAFSDCRTLSSVKLPQSLAKIGKRAFADCVKLEDISLPGSVRTIDMYAFYNCYILKEIKIPSGVTRISKGTFFNCSDLVSVSLPETLKVIETDAFYNCCELKSIKLPDSLSDMGRRPFEGCYNLVAISYKGVEYSVYIGDDDYDHADIIEAVTGIRPESSSSK